MLLPPAALLFAGAASGWLAGAAMLILGALAWRSYAVSPLSRPSRALGLGLRLLAVGALAACLLEPTLTGERAKPGANLVAIVGDNSRSMSVRIPADPLTPGEQAISLLAGDNHQWMETLGRQFSLRQYTAGTRLRSSADWKDLTFDARSSSLCATLREAAERHRGEPLAAIVLITDGVATDAAELASLPPDLPPVYPVVLGASAPPPDLGLGSISATQTTFEDAPVTVQLEVRASSPQARQARVSLHAWDDYGPGAQVATRNIDLPAGSVQTSVRLEFKTVSAGVSFYQASVAAVETGIPEATLLNNTTLVAVDRGRAAHRILYLGGRPNWEYKFLRRAVESDPQLQLVGLIRIARREAKFEFRGKEGDTGNPLFRGFENPASEEAERYDKPVLIRLNTRDGDELRGGMPGTAEELFGYQAVIIDDLEAEFFTREQMALLQQFVSRRGGGLLMLGGMESFSEGGFGRTAVGEMLPVYLDRRSTAPLPAVSWQWALTREGWLQAWARLRATEGEEKTRLEALPPYDLVNRVGGAKPAAALVATATAGAQQQPALVTQRFGFGRTGAMLLGDAWQAGLGDEKRAADLARSWRQTLRWLATDTPNRIELRAEPLDSTGAVRLEIDVRDAAFQPIDDARVELAVTPGGGDPAVLAPEPAKDQPGRWNSTFSPGEEGGYRVKATVRDESGASIGEAETGWVVSALDEFRSLVPDRTFLGALAARTGGKVLEPADLDRFAAELPLRAAPVREAWSQPLWHTPAVFLFAIACLAGEWTLRRRQGLP